MKEKNITYLLKSTVEADAPLHRAHLRRALLSMYGKPRFTLAALRGFVTHLSMKKYVLSAGAFAIVALLAVVTLNPTDPAVAQAQEQVARAFTRAIAISPEMRAELEAKMKSDMLETLKEAKAAPDLRILTKEEFEKESPFSFSTGPMKGAPGGGVPEGAKSIAIWHNGSAVPAGENAVFTVHTEGGPTGVGEVGSVKAISAMPIDKDATFSTGTVVNGMGGNGFSEPVKYLSYTDPKGNKTVLGLDKDDTPVFKIASISASNVMHFEDGSIGIPGEAIKMINVQGAQTIEQ